MANQSASVPKVIRRNSIKIELRGQIYEIQGLSIASLETFKQCLNSLITRVFEKIDQLPKLNWNPMTRKVNWFLNIFQRNKKTNVKVSTETTEFINTLIDTILKEPLELLESISGLPHEFFDPGQKDKCLSIEEIKQLTEAIFEVNGLGFIWAALKQWGENLVESMQTKSSVPSANGTDIPLKN
jgi:hypothetical protein